MRPKWGLGLGIGLITGLGLWLLSGPPFEVREEMPLVLWLWAPVTMTGILIYAELARDKRTTRWWKICGLVGLLTAYAILIPQWLAGAANRQFENLMLTHLPLLAWVGVGGYLLGLKAQAQDRLAVLLKSFELMIMAGLLMASGFVFMGITQILFGTMEIVVPEAVMRFGVTVGLGITALTVVMIGYNPERKPKEQNFKTGVYPLMALVARLFVPLVLLVLLMYAMVIPFNFWVPFNNRETLVTFNAVLLAVMALLIAATPIESESLELKWQLWLKKGMIAVAGVAIVITLYALSATVYRTSIDQWTVNRVVIMGWNLINMTVLGTLVWGQVKSTQDWVGGLQQTWSRAMGWWAVWVIGLIVILPWFFI